MYTELRCALKTTHPAVAVQINSNEEMKKDKLTYMSVNSRNNTLP